VKAGLTPAQALETATTNPALVLGLTKKWGRVAAGYSANFVILDKNPLADIANTETINAVVLNGKLFDRAQLDQMLNDAKAVDPAAVH
jgi:imidazolonepropionase-like amidohydrolase